MNIPVIVRQTGLADYAATLADMQKFNEERTPETPDEIWILEHPPVYTLGINADESHVIDAGNIPVVKVDRGGQVTWHGPGQLVVYALIDLGRARLGVRDLVCRLEAAIIETLAGYGIVAEGRENAPGVYVDGAKIASVGLRVRRNCCYHGISVNVNNNLEPFTRINPCGYEGLAVTRTADLGGPDKSETLARDLLPALLKNLGMSHES
ncbi:MAG: lipoyl(octanoyl) transferase LipB [Gammaproteobacteria bacterium]|jgi:lipoyl(octanoyl) transferase|nr:lipoyl(octanoyl) transferase LipB [Gammaproteobacteria bacterium]MDP6616192.1 lipoyl(octanoyl) transferase LipB [Gammaproteobacteria bacterium]MDP6695600.1 lipoyl(octanoyl) transferase LipB [Gammaproteobacteria bacterium]MDP7041713.1 lipoyl(octanoyl) transferase LipB [Gammaproteobacteria bacterium]